MANHHQYYIIFSLFYYRYCHYYTNVILLQTSVNYIVIVAQAMFTLALVRWTMVHTATHNEEPAWMESAKQCSSTFHQNNLLKLRMQVRFFENRKRYLFTLRCLFVPLRLLCFRFPCHLAYSIHQSSVSFLLYIPFIHYQSYQPRR